MATINWTVIEPAAVEKFMAAEVVDTANLQNLQGDRRLEGETGIVAAVVERIRGAVAAGRVTPLSARAGSVPPEAIQHALVLCVWALSNSTPGLGFTLKEGFDKMWQAAEDWLKAVQEGLPVTGPTDAEPGSGYSKAVLVRSGGDWLTRDDCDGL